MPMPAFAPTHAITASGRAVEFGILQYALYDLFESNYLHLQEYTLADFWLRSYMNGGALPGGLKFYDVFSGEEVYFLQMLDGLFEMYSAAVNHESINQSTSTASTDPASDDEIELWTFRPVNIGQFGLGIQARWIPPLRMPDPMQEVDDSPTRKRDRSLREFLDQQ